MEIDSSLAGELATLKQLAGEVMATELPDPDVLDRIATLAAEIAAQCREHARRQMVERVGQGVQTVFPAAVERLQSRLAQLTADELSVLWGLLDQVAAARTAFAHADADLRAAHERGDYAAMAPLALEADKHKSALAGAVAGFAERTGLGAELKPELELAATIPSQRAAAAETAGEAAEAPAAPAAEHEPAADPHVERPRLRDLIRQVRAAPDEAPARR